MVYPAFNEFVYYIVANGETSKILSRHVRSDSGEECACCDKAWPCNMRQLAMLALEVERLTPFGVSDPKLTQQPEARDPCSGSPGHFSRD